jgi:hypothetical protein
MKHKIAVIAGDGIGQEVIVVVTLFPGARPPKSGFWPH